MYEELVASTQRECSLSCENVKNCLWYSYNKVNHDCLLFSKCPGVDETEGNFISAEVGCKLSKSMTILSYQSMGSSSSSNGRYLS